jgi:putative hydrolase of the HAD superfamily
MRRSLEPGGVLFDLYGTLIDIETDESPDEIYRCLSLYLMYQDVYVGADDVRKRYWNIADALLKESRETYPEIDVEAIWNSLLAGEGMKSGPTRRRLARALAQLFRALSRKRFGLYEDVPEVLERLRGFGRLALVSDAQVCYALPEIRALGLDGYFDAVVLSGLHGFRKPDSRLFEEALKALKLGPQNVVHVGNDPYRDILGAGRLGIKTVLVLENNEARHDAEKAPDYVAGSLIDVLEGIELLFDRRSNAASPTTELVVKP